MPSQVKIDMTRIARKFDRAFGLLTSASSMNDIGKFAVETIVRRTRLGNAVARSGGPQGKFQGLSKSYKDARKGKVAFFTSAKTKKVFPSLNKGIIRQFGIAKDLNTAVTRPGKSNLSLTGQMLDNVGHKVRRKRITIFMRGKEADQKARWAEDGASNRPRRPFLHLGARDLLKIDQYVNRKLRLAFQILR